MGIGMNTDRDLDMDMDMDMDMEMDVFDRKIFISDIGLPPILGSSDIEI
jgi:hypothetical protein